MLCNIVSIHDSISTFHCSFHRLRDLGIARNSFAMTMNIPTSPPPLPADTKDIEYRFTCPPRSQPAAHRSRGQSSNSSFIGLHRRDLMPARVFRAHPRPLRPLFVRSLLFDDIKIVFSIIEGGDGLNNSQLPP